MSQRFKPYATVAIIIEHDHKFLIVEEVNDDQNNRPVFGMPAGHVEAKETILEAALREAREECGCEVSLEHLIGVYEYVKDQETIYRFCFSAKLQQIPSHLQSQDPDAEITAVKWYSKEEIYARREDWRTRLVGVCFDDYFKGIRFPLNVFKTINTVTR
ncbi:MAG: NUDIX domain-containing protein [Succinivibrio sp.]|nr:NUDIX domain-containing protein [Succinivibrio sp.]